MTASPQIKFLHHSLWKNPDCCDAKYQVNYLFIFLFVCIQSADIIFVSSCKLFRFNIFSDFLQGFHTIPKAAPSYCSSHAHQDPNTFCLHHWVSPFYRVGKKTLSAQMVCTLEPSKFNLFHKIALSFYLKLRKFKFNSLPNEVK